MAPGMLSLMGPCLGGVLVLGTLVGPARAGDSVGTGVVDRAVTAARLFLLVCLHSPS